MKRLLFVSSLFLLVYSSFAQQVNFVSTSFYNSTTCEVTIQVGLQRKDGGCGNTVKIAAVDFAIQWSSDLLLVSSSFIPSGAKLDDPEYLSSTIDNGSPITDIAPSSGNPVTTLNKGATYGDYKSYQFRRSTNKCANIISLECGMIAPFFTATFRLANCANASQYSFTYNNTAGANNTNYIAEFITNLNNPPSNSNKEILIYSSQTASFDDVSGNCNSGTINNVSVLSANISSNNFINTYGAILPLALDYFKAGQKHPSSVHLEWASLYEFNHSKFIVERSNDQRSWMGIETVPSLGNGDVRKVYQSIDRQPVSGINYYRLKQVDLEGGVSYSSVARINILTNKGIMVFPNPVKEIANLYSKEFFKAGQTIQMIDAKGTRIKTIIPTGGNRLQIDLSGYTSGLYLLQLIENGKVVENLQIVKQ